MSTTSTLNHARLARFENPPETPFGVTLSTHPARGNAGVAGRADSLKRFTSGRKIQIQIGLQRRVQGAALREARDRRDQLPKLRWRGHGAPPPGAVQAASARPALTLSIQPAPLGRKLFRHGAGAGVVPE